MSANRQTGEVSLEIQGRMYRLILDTNGMAHLEGLFGESESASGRALRALRVLDGAKDLRTVADYRHVVDDAVSILKGLQPLTFFDVLERVNKNSITHMRGLIWASLQKHHPDVTVQQTGELIESAGGILKFSEQLQALMQSATPDPEDLKDLGVPSNGNPPEAQDVSKRGRGTGGRSTSTHAAPA